MYQSFESNLQENYQPGIKPLERNIFGKEAIFCIYLEYQIFYILYIFRSNFAGIRKNSTFARLIEKSFTNQTQTLAKTVAQLALPERETQSDPGPDPGPDRGPVGSP